MSESRWRVAARRAIAEALLTVIPADDEKTVRATVNAHYPFGERKHLPYRMWLDEVKKVMLRRFPKPPVRPDDPRLVLTRGATSGTHTISRRLAVACGWCNQRGCLQCAAPQARLAALTGNDEWRALWIGFLDGETPANVLADYADEWGYEDVAALLRGVKS
jgi:hypothetical protein